MKKIIHTIQNIWRIEELRSKILYTLFFLLIYRVGSHIALPFIDSQKLELNFSSGGALGLLNVFAGGAFSKASIFALGIMPYISASIFMQLASIIIPSLQKLQKSGESGRNKIIQWTRYLTVVITIFQGSAYVAYINQMAAGAITLDNSTYFAIVTVLVLIAGTLFVMWLGERITDRGLGNGTSLIIMIGILAQFPVAVLGELQAKSNSNGGLLVFFIEMTMFILVIMFSVMITMAVRRVPLNYARQLAANVRGGASSGASARQFLPLKLSSSGVMPIIFAQAVMFFPTLFSLSGSTDTQGYLEIFSDLKNYAHMAIYAAIVLLFTFVYTALVFNPREISENLKRSNGFIPGVQPGEQTASFIGRIMDRITLPGGLSLAIIGILPGFAMRLGVTQGFAIFYGGTSLLIAVSVILDTMQQIETYLLMNKYDGLMKQRQQRSL